MNQVIRKTNLPENTVYLSNDFCYWTQIKGFQKNPFCKTKDKSRFYESKLTEVYTALQYILLGDCEYHTPCNRVAHMIYQYLVFLKHNPVMRYNNTEYIVSLSLKLGTLEQ